MEFKDFKLYNGSSYPCDNPNGPCCCGATHTWEESHKRLSDLVVRIIDIEVKADYILAISHFIARQKYGNSISN